MRCWVHTLVVVGVSGVVWVDVMTNLAFISRDVEGNWWEIWRITCSQITNTEKIINQRQQPSQPSIKQNWNEVKTGVFTDTNIYHGQSRDSRSDNNWIKRKLSKYKYGISHQTFIRHQIFLGHSKEAQKTLQHSVGSLIIKFEEDKSWNIFLSFQAVDEDDGCPSALCYLWL